MCGIAGYYSTQGLFDKEDLSIMTHALSHRGPDAEGFYFDETAGLGHRRLSIIDLSVRANQPMTSSNDRYVISYNGEVYNFREIGAKLKTTTAYNDTINFKTSSDTEVILEAFAHYGSDFVHHLNGMFTIAIYDKTEKEMFIFRDRLGIKPLYYYWDENNFAFASELKGLTELAKIPKSINKSAVRDFLHLGYIPTPSSIYKNIFKMHSGSILRVSRTGINIQKYWNIKKKFYNNTVNDKQQALVKISDILMSSVQYQLKSDVPFGVFLSGGIDSSLITAQAVELSSMKVNTFSIGFEENTHNESEYAKAIAKYLGTSHHEFIVTYSDAINLIDNVFSTFDEPFADSSAIPTLLVSKLAKEYVTVTLSGEGGDELFLGYGAYKWAERLHNPLIRLLRKPASNVFSKLSSRYKRIGKLLDFQNSNSLHTHIFSQEQYLFSQQELDNLLTDEFISSSLINETVFASNLLSNFNNSITKSSIEVKERMLNHMESQALFDLAYYLPDDLLTKVDRASMQYSLETRVPYLDHRLVELAINLAPNLKFRDGESKYILKQILYQYVPKKYFERPKQGFAIPLLIWLKKELKFLIDDFLNEDVVNRFGFVKYKEVKTLKTAFLNGDDYLYNRLWVLIVLHKWSVNHEKKITQQ
jgi:asparagine synthase (glutamine-hydrolysing)